MTKDEYYRLYRQARKSFPGITKEAMTELKRTYIEAGKLAAAEVRKAELAGLSDLTIKSWQNIEKQLEEGARIIRDNIEKGIYNTSALGISKTSEINQDYLIDAFKDIDQTKITQTGIKNLFRSVNTRVVTSIASRVYQDGYTFADRIWNAGLDYQKKIKDVITSGLAQGRDVIKIAKDIQVYIKDGKISLVNRYGDLKRGTSGFIRRIGDKVDSRALRLVRSELYQSLQIASAEQGRVNPGAIDMYDWFLSPGRQHWGCACPDNAANSPYTLQELPDYPHPNCVCDIRPVLRDRKEFVADLKRWANFEQVDYLDKWYRQDYQYMIS